MDDGDGGGGGGDGGGDDDDDDMMVMIQWAEPCASISCFSQSVYQRTPK